MGLNGKLSIKFFNSKGTKIIKGKTVKTSIYCPRTSLFKALAYFP